MTERYTYTVAVEPGDAVAVERLMEQVDAITGAGYQIEASYVCDDCGTEWSEGAAAPVRRSNAPREGTDGGERGRSGRPAAVGPGADRAAGGPARKGPQSAAVSVLQGAAFVHAVHGRPRG